MIQYLHKIKNKLINIVDIHRLYAIILEVLKVSLVSLYDLIELDQGVLKVYIHRLTYFGYRT